MDGGKKLGISTAVSTCMQLSHPRATPGVSEKRQRALRAEEFTTCIKHFHPNGFACAEGWDCDILVSLPVNT